MTLRARPRLRRWLLVGLAALSLGAVLLCGTVLAVGPRLSRPANRVVGPVPVSLAGAVPVTVPGPSAEAIHGWWMPGRTGGGAVLLVHGVWESRLSMVDRARRLHDQGFGVLLFDLRAHGESPGARITFGVEEGKDVAAAAAWVRARAPGERLGLIGFSLGGASAVFAPGPPLDAVVLESVYPTIDAALANRLRANLPAPVAAFVPLVAPVFHALMPLVIGVRPDQLRPIDHVAGLRAPLLLLTGAEDARTPLFEARALFAAAREPKQFHAAPGAAHVDLERFDPPAYWSVVLPFLLRALR